MNFTCSTVVIMEGKEKLPSSKIIFNSILEGGVVPIAIIKDRKNLIYKTALENLPEGFTLKYVILGVEYLKTIKT